MKVCVLPGDGIGPEIVGEALRVLEALRSDGLKLEMEPALLGGCAVDAADDPYPEATRKLARAADAVLLGAVGGPKWDTLPREKRPERGLLGLREELGLFANLRPVNAYADLSNASPLKTDIVAGLDILIVRELTGDIYFGEPRGIEERGGERVGINTIIYSESGDPANRQSGIRSGDDRGRKLCSVDKANVLESTQLWRDVVTETATGVSGRFAFPHVRRQRAMQLIRNPASSM